MVYQQGSQYFKQLDKVAEDVIKLLSETIDVNTIFLASNDQYSNFIVKAFNRRAILLNAGERTPFEDVLCKLVIDNDSEPIVISNLAENAMTLNHPVTLNIGNGSFLGAPIYKGDGEIYGTICAFDTKPYDFTAYDVRLIKTLSSLLSQTIILENLMLHDHLTGLNNGFYLTEFFNQTSKAEQQYSLLYVDLDRFKEVNDMYGHDIGDELLKKVASLFKNNVPEDSVVVRIGGDEFVFLIPVSTIEMIEAREFSEYLYNLLTTKAIEVEGYQLFISASIGMTFVDPNKTLKEIMKEADIAMYTAKRNSRTELQET
jgi:diguanylate cyclase (GGDEF)-like protein